MEQVLEGNSTMPTGFGFGTSGDGRDVDLGLVIDQLYPSLCLTFELLITSFIESQTDKIRRLVWSRTRALNTNGRLLG